MKRITLFRWLVVDRVNLFISLYSLVKLEIEYIFRIIYIYKMAFLVSSKAI